MMPPVDTAPTLTITPAAAARLHEVAEREGVDTAATYLRVLVVAGADDELLETGGLRVLLDPRSAAYLEGSTLDFSEGLDGRGFHFDNPQASRTCACGESFSL